MPRQIGVENLSGHGDVPAADVPAVTDQGALVERVRAALSAESAVREVKMFGGLAFMVNDKMVVSVGGSGDLLVRSDRARVGELLQVVGARPAEMGAGRAMGDGWITVDTTAIASDDELAYWIGIALAVNHAGE